MRWEPTTKTRAPTQPIENRVEHMKDDHLQSAITEYLQ